MSRTKTSNALVPVIPALPATQAFSMPADKHRQISEDFKRNVEWNCSFDKSQVNTMRFLGGTVTLAIGAGSVAVPPLLFLTVPVAAIFAWNGMGMQRDLEGGSHYAFERAKERAREKFEQAQHEFHAEQKHRIIELAEAHLGSGKLIAPQDAAWLANIDPDDLGSATDQLAITVLQIRQMLAHQRCNEFNSDGSRKADKPMTFQSVGFDASRALHRSWLREKLAQADSGIEEDGRFEIQQAEFVNGTVKKPARIKAAFNFLNPFSNIGRKDKLLAMEVPKVKEIEIPCAQPVKDFAEALAAYEAENPPLDLPAVRGWKGKKQRRALAAPKIFQNAV